MPQGRPRWVRTGVELAGIAASLAVAIAIGFRATDIDTPLARPALGLAVGLLLLRGDRRWPAVALGALAGALLAGRAPAGAALYAVGVVLGGLLATHLLRRSVGAMPRLTELRDAAAFVAILVGASAVNALARCAIDLAAGVDLRAALLDAEHSWLAHAAGAIVLTPALIALRRETLAEAARRWRELVALLAVTAAASWLFLLSDLDLMPFPLVLVVAWAGLRFATGITSLVVLLLSTAVITGVALGVGPFGTTHWQAPLLVATLAILGLVLRTLVVGRAEERLGRQRAERGYEELEARLRQAQKMEAVGTLAGGIAHDFNNLLAIILPNAAIARRGLAADDERRRCLDEIEAAATRGRDLVKSMLSFSRPRTDERTSLTLAPLVEETVRLVRVTAAANISLTVELAPDCPAVLGDAGQLQQVLVNLMTNGLQAMEQTGGTLAVSLERADHGREAVLAVSDTGAGMDAATLDRMFEPFFTTKAPGRGTGLGLAMVHGIVHSHGGRIDVDSAPGRGTTVRITLPAASTTARRPPPRSTLETAADGEVVLIVDDERGVARAAAMVLEDIGYRTELRGSGAEALELVAARPGHVAAVLTDLTMPGMSGLELAGRLRAVTPTLPIVLMTGHIDPAAARDAIARGVVDAILNKPFQLDEVAVALGHALHGAAAGASAGPATRAAAGLARL